MTCRRRSRRRSSPRRASRAARARVAGAVLIGSTVAAKEKPISVSSRVRAACRPRRRSPSAKAKARPTIDLLQDQQRQPAGSDRPAWPCSTPASRASAMASTAILTRTGIIRDEKTARAGRGRTRASTSTKRSATEPVARSAGATSPLTSTSGRPTADHCGIGD